MEILFSVLQRMQSYYQYYNYMLPVMNLTLGAYFIFPDVYIYARLNHHPRKVILESRV